MAPWVTSPASNEQVAPVPAGPSKVMLRIKMMLQYLHVAACSPHSEMVKKEDVTQSLVNFFTTHIEQIRSVRLRCFLPFQALVFAHIRSSLHKGTRFSIRLRLSGVSPFTNAFCEGSMQDRNESL